MSTALFTGSFDPFTIGHASIVERALPLFSRMVIAVGVNEHKKGMFSIEERVARIRRHYADEPRIEVLSYSNLTVDLAKEIRADVIIKGIRSVKDFENEREQADINRQIGGIETLFLFALPQFESISSSIVRELIHFNRDVSDLMI